MYKKLFSLTNKIIIVAGHYGSGKTTLALNLALSLSRAAQAVALCDMDVINPYFRAADGAQALSRAGVRLISPLYANTNLEAPALPAAVRAVLTDPSLRIIIDAGGDDAGALALGPYRREITAAGYDMLLVANARRALTRTPASLLAIRQDIERACGLRFTGLVHNTNIGADTTAQTVEDAADYAQKAAALLSLPLVMTCCRADLPGAPPDAFSLRVYEKGGWAIF